MRLFAIALRLPRAAARRWSYETRPRRGWRCVRGTWCCAIMLRRGRSAWSARRVAAAASHELQAMAPASTTAPRSAALASAHIRGSARIRGVAAISSLASLASFAVTRLSCNPYVHVVTYQGADTFAGADTLEGAPVLWGAPALKRTCAQVRRRGGCDAGARRHGDEVSEFVSAYVLVAVHSYVCVT